MDERYQIKYGKFGAYFFDSDEHEDVTLEEALAVMNNKDAGFAAGLERALKIIENESKYFIGLGEQAAKKINDLIEDDLIKLQD